MLGVAAASLAQSQVQLANYTWHCCNWMVLLFPVHILQSLRHAKEMLDQQSTGEAAAEAAEAAHAETVQQLKQLLDEQTAAAHAQVGGLLQQIHELQERCAAVAWQLKMLLQLPHQQQRALPHSDLELDANKLAAAASNSSSSNPAGLGSEKYQPACQPGVDKGVIYQPLMPQELLETGAGLFTALPGDASMEDAATALQALMQEMVQHIADLMQQVLGLQQQNHLLLQDGAALAVDFQTCATNLQSLVATMAFSIPLTEDVQQGLNAKDPAVFDEQLATVHQVTIADKHADKHVDKHVDKYALSQCKSVIGTFSWNQCVPQRRRLPCGMSWCASTVHHLMLMASTRWHIASCDRHAGVLRPPGHLTLC